MKKTHNDRVALLDRLEKKYIKKVQLQAFRRESEQIKRRLQSIRGRDIRQLIGGDTELVSLSEYRPRFT